MTPEQRLLLRHALLRQLAAAAPASLPLATLQQGTALAGFSLSDDLLRVELDYLAGKGLATLASAALSPALVRVVLTSAGRDYLEAQSLA
jgi:hypothetical protein